MPVSAPRVGAARRCACRARRCDAPSGVFEVRPGWLRQDRRFGRMSCTSARRPPGVVIIGLGGGVGGSVPPVGVVVVGAGIAGIACARELTAAGVEVRVLERARVVGGRMASRRLHGRPVDLGAAYFTVSDPGFAEVVDGWEAAGLARPWTDTLAVLGDGERGSSQGPMRWAAPGGLRSLVTALAEGLDITLEHEVAQGRPRPGRRRRARRRRRPGHAGPAGGPAPGSRVPAAWPTARGTRCSRSRRDGPSAPGPNCLPPSSTTIPCSPSSPTTAPGAATAPLCSSRTRRRPWPARTTPIRKARCRSSSTPCATCSASGHRSGRTPTGGGSPRPPKTGKRRSALDGGIGLAGDGWGRSRVEAAWRSGTDLGRALGGR